MLLSLKTSHLKESGWYNSVLKQKTVDKNNSAIPWYTYSFLDFIMPRIIEKIKIFEYGAGYSTIWWSKFASEIISCEHDQMWIEKIRPIPNNVNVFLKELDYDYVDFIKNYENYFDIVIIDGRKRNDCMKNCLKSLKNNGIIILDNSDRVEYEEGCKYITSHDYKRLDFWGMGPVVSYKWCTTIFYKETNFLGI